MPGKPVEGDHAWAAPYLHFLDSVSRSKISGFGIVYRCCRGDNQPRSEQRTSPPNRPLCTSRGPSFQRLPGIKFCAGRFHLYLRAGGVRCERTSQLQDEENDMTKSTRIAAFTAFVAP